MQVRQFNLVPSTVVMPKHTVECFIFDESGALAVYDDEGDFACEIYVDAIPGLDVYEIH